MALTRILKGASQAVTIWGTTVTLKVLTGEEYILFNQQVIGLSKQYKDDEQASEFVTGLLAVSLPYIISIEGVGSDENITDVLRNCKEYGRMIMGIQEKLIEISKLTEAEIKNSNCSSESASATSTSNAAVPEAAAI